MQLRVDATADTCDSAQSSWGGHDGGARVMHRISAATRRKLGCVWRSMPADIPSPLNYDLYVWAETVEALRNTSTLGRPSRWWASRQWMLVGQQLDTKANIKPAWQPRV